MRITWLGQSGYLLEADGLRLALDPYLGDAVERLQGLRRLMPPPCTAAELRPDALLITHDHLDHFDPATVPVVMAACPGCRLVGPASVMEHGRRDGFAPERLIPIAVGGTVRIGGIAITATPALHSDAAAVGFVVRSATICAWFSGDTRYAPDLATRVRDLADGAPDLACICINGRLGNMGLAEAVQVMAALRPGTAIPAHYGMFAENTADPDAFLAACAAIGQPAVRLQPGLAVACDDLLHRTLTP